jgi:hypothetical protein
MASLSFSNCSFLFFFWVVDYPLGDRRTSTRNSPDSSDNHQADPADTTEVV